MVELAINTPLSKEKYQIMCGIVGFTSKQQAAPILLDGLSKLEYRGYDSAGIAVRDGSNLAEVVKATGKLRNLSDKTDDGNAIHGTCGIVIQDGLFPYFL
jgi:glucosamine--fructose-6-phosphate aminotransferase (isomerizing)